jgi:hypothetical protein
VLVVAAGRLVGEPLDLLRGDPGLAEGLADAGQDGEGVAVLPGQLHEGGSGGTITAAV